MISTSSSTVAVGRGVVAATVVVLVDVGLVVVATGARGVAVPEVAAAAVVDEGAEEEIVFAAAVEPVRVGGFVPAAFVALSVLHAAMLMRPMARTATPTLRRS
ncbi:MAG: hypothetical protein ABW328_11960 [Ilumatobacteraceae bacterium]